jgi:F-type H+-transporting ATPase subunit b
LQKEFNVRATVTLTGDHVEVRFVATTVPGDDEAIEHAETEDVAADDHDATEGPAVPEEDLNPIFPEVKEVLWGFGSFVVLALLMRYFLYPRLRRGMDARYGLITSGHEQAEQITASAKGDVAEYEFQLAAARAEAAQRLDLARATLEAERSERLAEVNARIAERRAAAAAELESAREAVQGDVEAAVRDVAARAGRLATGREPDPAVVTEAVRSVMSVGAGR